MATRAESSAENNKNPLMEGGIMEPTPRGGEDSVTIPFRSSRFFCVGNQWYFTTREGFDSGPYATRERAEIGLQRFLKVARMLPEQQNTYH